MKAIIFDFDGVLVGNRQENLESHQQKYRGMTSEIHLDLFDGNIHVIRQKLIDSGAIEEKSKEHIHSILNERILKKNSLSDEAKEILRSIKEDGYLLFILSSNNGENIKSFLKGNDSLDLFDGVFGYEPGVNKQQKFQSIIKQHDLVKDKCFFITDTLGDIFEANKVGIKTIAVDFGIHSRKRLEIGKPFAVASNFKEIYELIS